MAGRSWPRRPSALVANLRGLRIVFAVLLRRRRDQTCADSALDLGGPAWTGAICCAVVNVHNATLKALLQGEKQFRVPIWQRQYTWHEEQHSQLWRDLMEQYALLAVGDVAERISGHFLGSFVLAPVDPAAVGVGYFLVIDGQQRLTTLMLVLCALRDTAREAGDTQADERYDELYLINKFQQGDSRYRLQPTLEDRPSFVRWVEREPDAGARDGLSEAYRFFRAQLAAPLPGGEPLDLDLLVRVVVERLAIVMITTDSGDNVHRIFQSLNGTGVPLKQADLLRNYIFMLLPIRAEHVYSQVWHPMEQLIGVENLEGLARVDLLRRGEDVARDDVYAAHEQRLAPYAHDEDAIEAQVRDLALRARHYKPLIDPEAEPDSALRAGLARLGRWGAQTSHPVLMFAFDLREREIIGVDELRRAVDLIESFLVRRQLARIPTNALNRVFVQLIEYLPEDASFADALHRELSRDRLYWPSDDGIRDAVRRQPFFHIGRGHQRKMILERLERSFDHPEVIDFMENELQVEHIMPQTLNSEWREHLSGLGDDPDLVHLELVHTGFNGTLSNSPFERKQEIYGDSHLELNRALADTDGGWGRDQILARAGELAEHIIRIWPAPIPGVVSAGEDGFDWSRVDVAIAAIPAGRWTAYGDLAEIGGTGAQSVGNYVTTASPNAHRVLSSDGSISGGFRWPDPADDRDVRTVLVAEGLNFDESDRASLDQKITAAQLIALTETPEDESQEEASPAREAAATSPSGSDTLSRAPDQDDALE
jgi:alkylated DNA nucleotide flippase Atl1